MERRRQSDSGYDSDIKQYQPAIIKQRLKEANAFSESMRQRMREGSMNSSQPDSLQESDFSSNAQDYE